MFASSPNAQQRSCKPCVRHGNRSGTRRPRILSQKAGIDVSRRLAGNVVLRIQQSNEHIQPHDGRMFCRLPNERWPATVAAVTGIVPNFNSADAQTGLLQEFQTAVRSLFDPAVAQAAAKKDAARVQAHLALQQHATEQQRATARTAKQEFLDAVDYAVQIANFSGNQSVSALTAMLVNDYEELAQIEL